MKTAAISSLAMALSLGLITTAEADDWTGPYATLGFSFADTNLQSGFVSLPFGESDRNIGPYAALGYDWAVGDLTYGVLADVEFTRGDDRILLEGKSIVGESDWFATLRARVGGPINDRLHIFASAGPAMIKVRGEAMLGDFDGAQNSTIPGLAGGLAMEYQLAPGRHLTIEYLHAKFDPAFIGEDVPIFMEPVVNSLRIGYTIRF